MAITCLKPEHHDRDRLVRQPFTVVEVAIFDETTSPCRPGERGEIVVRGPQTMARYWDRPEETAEAFRNGWLHTGDIGMMDEDGFFYIVDRKNDMLIFGGYNVYPREVEDVLTAFPGVVEAAVVGLPDDEMGRPRRRRRGRARRPRQAALSAREEPIGLQKSESDRNLAGAAEKRRQQDFHAAASATLLAEMVETTAS